MKLSWAVVGVVLALLGLSDASADETGRSASDAATKHVYKRVGTDTLALFVCSPPGHKADAQAPAIVFFHGGGFKNGTADQFKEQAKYLASRGMVAASANYRLIKDRSGTIEDCVEDAKSAMRWVRANAGKLGIDPDRIAAGGGSAGGYLAASTLLQEECNATSDPADVSAKPNALVLFNPGFGSEEKAEEAARRGRTRRPPEKGVLVNYVKPGQPPCINFFGTEDKMLLDAQHFQEAYQKAGNRCEIVTYEGQGHSFFNKPEYREKTLAEADAFLVELGWLVPQSKPAARTERSDESTSVNEPKAGS